MSTLPVVSWCRVDNRVSVCEALRKYWLPWAPALLSPFPNTEFKFVATVATSGRVKFKVAV